MIKKRRNFAERRSDSGLGQMERKRKQRKEFLTRALGNLSIAAVAVAAAINFGLGQEKDESPEAEAAVSVQVGDVVQSAIDEAIDKDRQRSPEVKKVERQIDGLAAQAADVTRRAKAMSGPGKPFLYQETPGNDLVVEKNADGIEMYTKLNSATITTGDVEVTVTYAACKELLQNRDNCLNKNDEVDPEGKNIVEITTKYFHNNQGIVVRRSNSAFGGLYSVGKRGVPKTPEQRDKVPVNTTAMVWRAHDIGRLTKQASNDVTTVDTIVSR